MFNNKNKLKAYAGVTDNSTNANELIFTTSGFNEGQSRKPAVGDYVTMGAGNQEGVYCGEIRKVTAVEDDTPSAGYTKVTVDDDFSANPDSLDTVFVEKWKELKKWELTSTLDLTDDLYIPVNDMPFDDLVFMLTFNVPAGESVPPPSFGPITFVYNAKRIKRTEV